MPALRLRDWNLVSAGRDARGPRRDAFGCGDVICTVGRETVCDRAQVTGTEVAAKHGRDPRGPRRAAFDCGGMICTVGRQLVCDRGRVMAQKLQQNTAEIPAVPDGLPSIVVA